MELLIIRHGQSEADLLRCHEGRADFPLTETGKKQAVLLAEWLVDNYPPDYIVSSPLQRAKQTAAIIGEKSSLNIRLLDELMEFNNGLLAGLPYEEAARKYPPKRGRNLMKDFTSRNQPSISGPGAKWPFRGSYPNFPMIKESRWSLMVK